MTSSLDSPLRTPAATRELVASELPAPEPVALDSPTLSAESRAQLPPLFRLVVVGMLVPVMFATVDAWLLQRMQFAPSSTLGIVATMTVFVVQVGLLGWLCGRWIENPWWRWGLYCWGWILVDLQLFAAATFADGANYWNHGRMLPGSLFAAQAGLAMVWGFLGSSRWTLRIPACTLLVFVFAWLSRGGYGMVREMVPLQLAALAALCGLLRLQRFRLLPIARNPGHALDKSLSTGLPTMQFGIRHVLIWTTSLAVLLGMLRALELLSLDSLRVFYRAGFVSLVSLGLAVAITFVVAVWAALGGGPAWLRLPLLGLVLPVAGLAMAILFWNSERIRWSPGTTFSDLWKQPWMWQQFWKDDVWLAVWVALAGSLLFASLIILRTIGYRLVRTARKSSAGRAA
jgi:hypothetical protein